MINVEKEEKRIAQFNKVLQKMTELRRELVELDRDALAEEDLKVFDAVAEAMDAANGYMAGVASSLLLKAMVELITLDEREGNAIH